MKTFKAMLIREFILAKRTWTSLILSLGMPVAFFLLFSASNDFSHVSAEIVNQIYRQVLMAMTASSILSISLYTLPYLLQADRVGNRLRMIQHSPVPMWQYYLVKMLRLLLYFTVSVVVVFAVGHVVRHIQMPLNEWMMSVGLLFLGASLTMPLGLLLSLIDSSEVLSVAANICYMGLAILGGLWLPLENFPNWLQAIGKWTPTHQALNLLLSYYEGNFSWQSLQILVLYAIIVLGIFSFLQRRKDVV